VKLKSQADVACERFYRGGMAKERPEKGREGQKN